MVIAIKRHQLFPAPAIEKSKPGRQIHARTDTPRYYFQPQGSWKAGLIGSICRASACVWVNPTSSPFHDIYASNLHVPIFWENILNDNFPYVRTRNHLRSFECRGNTQSTARNSTAVQNAVMLSPVYCESQGPNLTTPTPYLPLVLRMGCQSNVPKLFGEINPMVTKEEVDFVSMVTQMKTTQADVGC